MADTNGLNGVNGHNGYPSANAAKHNLAPHFIGGNHLGVASPGKVKEFVAANGGHTVVTNVRLRKIEAAEHRAGANGSLTGPHRQQWYRRGQGNQIGAEVGIRDVWR